MAGLVLVPVGSSQQQSRLIIQRTGRRSLASSIIRRHRHVFCFFCLLFSRDKEGLCVMFVFLNNSALKMSKTNRQRASL